MFLLNEVNESYNKFADKVYENGALNRKAKELIALACSVMADCSPCIEHHYRGATGAGASQEEIAEALAVSMAICAGSKKAKYSQLVNNLSAEKK